MDVPDWPSQSDEDLLERRISTLGLRLEGTVVEPMIRQLYVELTRKKMWRQIFGPTSREETPDTYRPRPFSRSYVMHLEDWYAQSHPDEDFAETFAVWLTPGLDWRKRYAGWKALQKLEYVDELM